MKTERAMIIAKSEEKSEETPKPIKKTMRKESRYKPRYHKVYLSLEQGKLPTSLPVWALRANLNFWFSKEVFNIQEGYKA